ncbi:MAG: sulfatase [Myxococcales bacterium]|nr:sulfatase [Myxococcales bacterium]
MSDTPKEATKGGPRVLAGVARAAELVVSAPVIGAAFVLLLTQRAFAGGDDDKVFGVRTTAIVDLAKRSFQADVRALTYSLIAVAAALGAAIGVVVELLLVLRRPSTTGRRFLARFGLVVAVYLLVLGWGIAGMPQLYAETMYHSESALRRGAEVFVTDWLGRPGVVALAVLLVLAWWRPKAHELQERWRVARPWLRRHGRVLVPVLGAIVLLASGLAIKTRVPHARVKKSRPNVLILAVDSLRDDRLVGRTAPHLSQVAATGAQFTRAYVTLPRTLPSWTTILTGREPHEHGLRTMFPRYEDRARDLAALPQRLGKLGYKSAVVGDYAADIFTRVRYGFDTVDAPTFNFHTLIATRALSQATPLLPFLHGRAGRAILPAMRELNQAADPSFVAKDTLRALDKLDGDAPFFLTVFFSTAHFPYAAPAPYYARFGDPSYKGRFKYHKPNVLGQEQPLDEADIRQVRALYDGAVASVDDAAAQILESLRMRGLAEDTIVVVTADHGEMLFDDGHGQGHGDHLFGDQVVHVPLAIRVPGKGPTRVDSVVRDVDLAPTLLELVGAPKDAAVSMIGRSLRPAIDGGSLPSLPAFSETEVWMTESIPELPSGGDNPLRIPYPNVAQTTELDPRLAYDVVMRAEMEPLIVAAKHRMILEGDLKLVYVPTRKGPRFMLYDRKVDPAEKVDLFGPRKADALRLRGLLFRWILGDPGVEEREGMIVPRTFELGGSSTALRLP